MRAGFGSEVGFFFRFWNQPETLPRVGLLKEQGTVRIPPVSVLYGQSRAGWDLAESHPVLLFQIFSDGLYQGIDREVGGQYIADFLI